MTCNWTDERCFALTACISHLVTQRRLPDSAIDLLDEASASVKVARETRPEQLDLLERQKLELEVEIHALDREKDAASKERAETARKTLQDLEDQLEPLRAEYEVRFFLSFSRGECV